MRAIGYFEIEEEKDGSLAEAEKDFVEYCRLNLHQPFITFSSSGRVEGEENTEYRRMIDYMQQSGSKFLVVVPDARHLGSDLELVARSLVELDAVGARVTCSDEDFPDLLQNAYQTLGIKGVSRTRSRRIKESMRARALQGQALGKPLYGYHIGPEGMLDVVPEEAAVVELIYRLYTREGLGLRLIAQHLNERGIPTRRGGKWNVVSIRDILRNISYTGTYTRFGMRRSKVHEAIIPAEVFRTAQDQTRTRRPVGRVARPEPFLLSGILYCSYCGNKMIGVTRRQTWKRKDGRRGRNVYRYYQCQSRNNLSLCGYHTWRAPVLEGTVLSQLGHALAAKASPRALGDDGDGAPRLEEAQAMRVARVRNAERRFLRGTKRYARGDLSVKGLGEYLNQLDTARRAMTGGEHFQDAAATLDGWESLDMEARRSFLFEQIARVVVEDNRIEVEV